MHNPRRRYFVAEGPIADNAREDVIAAHNEHKARMDKLKNSLGAAGFMTTKGKPYTVLMSRNKPGPAGTRFERTVPANNTLYDEFKPLRSTRPGRVLMAKMHAVGHFDASDRLLRHFGINNAVIGTDKTLWQPTAGVLLASRLVLVSVPEDDKTPFLAPGFFREVDHAEFLRLREASNG